MTIVTTTRTAVLADPILGSGLSSTARLDLADDLQEMGALAQALREAISQARAGGVDAFAPDDATAWTPPAMAPASLKAWFAEVIGHPYSAADATASLPDYGALTLAQWSLAAEALEQRSARDRSRLPPGQGGGAQHALGAWYVNGQRYSLAELFIAVRMGNFSDTEKFLEGDLNTLAANAQLGRDLLEILADLKRRRGERSLAHTATTANPTPTFDPDADFNVFVVRAGLTLDQISGYGVTLKGTGSLIKLAVDGYNASPRTPISSADYTGLMDEIQALFDSVNADNQVKQVQIETIHNARSTILLGMSTFLKGAAALNQQIDRNL